MAGLLDGLFSGSDSGGLLDFLRRNNSLALPPADPANGGSQWQGAPVSSQPVGIYRNNQSSPLDSAQWPSGPVGSPSNAMAQAIPQQPPPVIQAQMPAPTASAPAGPAVGDRVINSLQSFANSGGILPALVNGFTSLATGQRTDPEGIQLAQQQRSQNLTAQALLQKGVSPTDVQAAINNPELMKALVAQNYGTKAVQALGNGYIYNPKTNKVERAYEPDEKTPVGFEKGDDGNLHFIKGGPADPAYLRLKETAGTDPNAVKVLGKGGELWRMGPNGPEILHKNQEGTDATLSDEATKAMASQYLSGDKSVLQNLGRGAQGAANIVKLREEITNQAKAAGLSAKDVVDTFNEQAGNLAGQRSIGTRAANISLAANEANNMIPIALKASDAVPRGEWMPWNKMVQAYQTGTSSPELARFVAATNSLVNAYVRAVSPSGVPTDSMREHAYSMLNSAQSAKAYRAVTEIMQDEMKAALSAPAQVRKELRGEKSEGEKSPKVTTIDGYKIMEH